MKEEREDHDDHEGLGTHHHVYAVLLGLLTSRSFPSVFAGLVTCSSGLDASPGASFSDSSLSAISRYYFNLYLAREINSSGWYSSPDHDFEVLFFENEYQS